MTNTSLVHLVTLVGLIENSANAITVERGTPLQEVCQVITRAVQFKDAVLWLEENLPGFKEREEEPSG